ncbi:unnamed protein product [Rotaria sordida]|uniref:Uncharacterized protein n=1 Tax=Rotaria sordida TaxID=392033 RepID=A0A815PEK5_9BILA|nr:unnamed protein product [Rotaria sordida]CAF4059898.1 unnamed protein product [Rotaria sordida]
MSDRNTEYILIRNRKPKKSRQHYYDEDANYDDDEDDDDDSQIYARLVPRKPRKEQRIKYISNDENDFDYRRQISDSKIRTRKKTNGNQIILNEGDIIKVIRNSRTPSPLPIERGRLKSRPRVSQSVFYETSSGHLISRPFKKNTSPTKKTQVVYADDEPTRVIKKVIIDPRTGDRETIYKKDKPKKQRKYYMPQHPNEILFDSDDDDDDDDYEQYPKQYVKLSKHRNVSTEVLPRRESSPKYIMIKKKVDSEPAYTLTSKMPSIKTNRRVVYEIPTKKSLANYVYSSNGKYYK